MPLGAERGQGQGCGLWLRLNAAAACLRCGGLRLMALGWGNLKARAPLGTGHPWLSEPPRRVQAERSCLWRQGLDVGAGREMGLLDPACPQPCPPRQQATAKSFTEYLLCCLSPLAPGLMVLRVLTVWPPAGWFPSVG